MPELKIGQIREFLTQLKSDGTIFRLDDEGIFRHFCRRFLARNEAFSEPLDTLRNDVAPLLGRSDAPSEPQLYLSWFRNTVISLHRLPRDCLAELHDWADEDLCSIAETIKLCNNELEALKHRKDGDAPIDRRFYEYFKKLNITARDEIVDVLSTRIKDEAFARSREKLIRWFDFDAPWQFRWLPDRFDPRKFSEIRHRFGLMPVAELEKVEIAYLSDPDEFDSLLHQYYDEHRPVAKLRQLIQSHHRLNDRSSLLVPLLDSFERDENLLFCTAAVVQIEGLFEDCCLELGVDSSSLLTSTLVPKLDAMHKHGGVSPSYEYYAFGFPKLRNQLAHGRIPENNWRRTADLLLLDLLEVSETLVNLDTVQSALVNLLQAGNSEQPKDCLKFASLLAEGAVEPASFYELGNQYRTFRDTLNDMPSMWDLARDLFHVHKGKVASALHRIAVKLKVQNIAREDALLLLKTIGSIDSDSPPVKRTELWSIIDSLR